MLLFVNLAVVGIDYVAVEINVQFISCSKYYGAISSLGTLPSYLLFLVKT